MPRDREHRGRQIGLRCAGLGASEASGAPQRTRPTDWEALRRDGRETSLGTLFPLETVDKFRGIHLKTLREA
jgi:hypothetical protein